MSKRPRTRIAVLISGRGSNLGALLSAAAEPDYPAEIVLVVSSRTDAAGLELAKQAGVTTAVVEPGSRARRAESDTHLHDRLRAANVEIVCLAGYMHLLSADFVNLWRDRIINIHPSLLPSFKGLDTHARALAAGVRLHGCTVHFVRAEVDDGPIIAQAAVCVSDSDTTNTLAAKVLVAEHRLYPRALAMVASGATRIEGARVLTDSITATEAGILFSVD
jgi:phosphoribosylglycinamide formyltransferase-1